MSLQEMSGGNGADPAANPTPQSIGSTSAAGSQEPGGDPSQGSGTGTAGPEGSAVRLAAWTQQVPKEIRENPELARELANFEKLEDLVKAHFDLKGKWDQRSPAIPGKDAKPEDVAAFWKALGYPEKPDGYALAKDKNAGTFLTAAHAARLTDEQASAMWKEVSSNQSRLIASRQEAQQAEVNSTIEALKKEYGEKFPAAVEMFDRAIGNTGKEHSPLMQQLLAAGLVGNQTIIKAFIALGEARQESGSPSSGNISVDPNKPVTEGGWYSYKNTKEK
jgi:hypothetical protein